MNKAGESKEAPLLGVEDARGRGSPAGRVAAVAAALALAGCAALATGLARGGANSTVDVDGSVALRASAGVCAPGHASSAASLGLPLAHIVGADAPPPHRHWNARICSEAYEGPDCTNATAFNAEVTICIDGEPITGQLRTRGHVSAELPKQQYLFTLPHAQSLLGMAAAKNWVLCMPFDDTSFQRNSLAFGIYRALGGWAPHVRFVSMWWGETDFGLYYIGELIEAVPGRLQMPPPGKTPESTSYLLGVDWPKPGMPHVLSTNTSTFFNLRYPPSFTGPQYTYVAGIINEVDRRAADLSDETLEEVLDFGSAARFYVLMELVKDGDGYAFSDYWQLRGGRLEHAAPWDFDMSMGYECLAFFFTNSLTGHECGWLDGWNVENSRIATLHGGAVGNYNGGGGGVDKRQLFRNIWQHPSFRRAFAAAWRAARAHALADEALVAMIQDRNQDIAAAAEHDMHLWRDSARQAFFNPCFTEDTRNFTVAISHVQEFLLGRARWVDEHLDDLLAPSAGGAQ